MITQQYMLPNYKIYQKTGYSEINQSTLASWSEQNFIDYGWEYIGDYYCFYYYDHPILEARYYTQSKDVFNKDIIDTYTSEDMSNSGRYTQGEFDDMTSSNPGVRVTSIL